MCYSFIWTKQKITSEINFLFQKMDLIKDLVISIIPSLSDETLAYLLEVLVELGVENKEDFMLVEEKDIEIASNTVQKNVGCL